MNARARKAVAKPLGLATLPIDPIRKLERLIAIYQATARGLKGTTPGGTLAVFDEIERSTKRLASALRYFKNDRSGVDAETFDAMSPTARECLSSIERLCSVAEVQRARLRKHPRVYPAQEALRYFCGMLRLFFERFAEPSRRTGPEASRFLRGFALAVLTEVGVDHADFESHPDRLDELLGADIPPDDKPAWAKV